MKFEKTGVLIKPKTRFVKASKFNGSVVLPPGRRVPGRPEPVPERSGGASLQAQKFDECDTWEKARQEAFNDQAGAPPKNSKPGQP